VHSMHQIPGHDPGHGPASSSNRALLERPEWHWPKAARKPSSSSNDRRRDLAEPDLALAEALALNKLLGRWGVSAASDRGHGVSPGLSCQCSKPVSGLAGRWGWRWAGACWADSVPWSPGAGLGGGWLAGSGP
jgi:hypothetical protein